MSAIDFGAKHMWPQMQVLQVSLKNVLYIALKNLFLITVNLNKLNINTSW